MVFRVASGGGSSGLVIGAGATPITGGTASRVLFEGATNVLSESADFTFAATTGVLTIGGTTAGAGIVLTGGTVTASSPLFNGTQTWNAAGVKFNLATLTATATAYAAGSAILNLGGGVPGTSAGFYTLSTNPPAGAVNYIAHNATATGTLEEFCISGVRTGAIFAQAGGILQLASSGTQYIELTGSNGSGVNISAGSASSDLNLLSGTQTWNNSGTSFTGIKFTITDTASAAGALAMQILGGAAGTTSLFKVTKGGKVDAPAYAVNGTDGLASFNGAVTNITVVNGIVTAAS